MQSLDGGYMAQWAIWLGAAGVLVLVELLTGTFYLLMIAIGLIAGGIFALVGWDLAWQLIIAAVVGLIATGVLRRSKLGKRSPVNAERDSNVNLDIGQAITVNQWQESTVGVGQVGQYTARIKYRGAMWDVELEQHAVAQSGVFFIREVRGSRLILGNSPS